jgi:hypothetical protein
LVERIAANIPEGVSLLSLSATSTPPVPAAADAPTPAATTETTSGASTETTTTPTTVAPPPPTISGELVFQGKARDYPTLAKWIDSMGNVPEITDVYVSSAQAAAAGTAGTSSGISFSATAVLSPKSASDRVGSYVKEQK